MKAPKQLLTIAYTTILLLCAEASAQTAEQLFNPAAKEYIYGNTPVASNLVELALNKFPDDQKLQKLKKLIEQQQQQKQNQDQQNDQKKNDQKNQDQKKKNQDQKNKQDQKNQDQDNSKNKNDENPTQSEPQESRPKQAGEMSAQEAQQLLDAMKQNEKDQRANLTPYLGAPVRVDKDW